MPSGHLNGHPDWQSLALWFNETATPTRYELQASIPYLAMLVQHLDGIAEVDELLVVREDIDWTNRVIFHTSTIVTVIEEEHQGPLTAEACAK